MTFTTWPIRPRSLGLIAALPNRTEIAIPHLEPERYQDFYRFCRSYAGGHSDALEALGILDYGPYASIANVCSTCQGGGLVLNRKRELRRCPRAGFPGHQ